ncbi:hypothetical protein [Terrihalobacillus insolitus]|uniref:hypothetical protein n=1 Tax=Terrihalobacillus insolitus TaxID=2950438 RepID=UPI00233F8E52|nr:hypothetical protein [Terrihalobacillus insolitus]MDC3414933.1 hypothetical protein [Terrihalobacillus insolitus]
MVKTVKNVSMSLAIFLGIGLVTLIGTNPVSAATDETLSEDVTEPHIEQENGHEILVLSEDAYIPYAKTASGKEIDLDVILDQIEDGQLDPDSLTSESTSTSPKMVNESPLLTKNSAVRPMYSYLYRVYTESDSYQVNGTGQKITPTVYGPMSVSETTTVSTSNSYSANVGTDDIPKIKIGASFTFTTKNSASVRYSLDLKSGEHGYIKFFQLYNKTRGTLKTYSAGSGTSVLLETKSVTGQTPVILSNGVADGTVIPIIIR